MANIEYAHTFTYGVETSQTQSGLTVTKGSWTRETTDRVLPTLPQQSTEQDLHKLIYTPLPVDLKATRILRLEPGGFEDVLHGSLAQCFLSDSGPTLSYTALSYAWGDPSDVREILMDGQAIRVPANLASALRQVRHETSSVALWADAICINQHNVHERSEQVGMMVDIFTAAIRVYAWLGPETADTAIGMRVFRHMLIERPGEREAPWEVLPAGVLQAGIADIAKRDYFQRLWVVQEASLAAEVELACGGHSIIWKNSTDVVRRFERSVKLAGISPQWQSMDLPNLSPFLQLLIMQLDTSREAKTLAIPRRSPGMLDVIYELRHRRVTDPRDRYYALLGIIGSEQAVRLTPDYTLPVEEVYGQVVRLVMQEESEQALDTVASFDAHPPESASRLSSLRIVEGSTTGDGSAELDEVSTRISDNGSIPAGVTENRDLHDEPTQALRQRGVLISHVEATCSRAAALIASGSIRRAAALLTVLAHGVENYSEDA
ncbi:hypothetical protein LTR17_001591 [Elasticomyces elasticus]|nr:hypothetical protein LTR17_001591 [Elasticomyces elasticus]